MFNLNEDDTSTIAFALLLFYENETYSKDKKAVGKQIKHIMKELDPNTTYLLHGES